MAKPDSKDDRNALEVRPWLKSTAAKVVLGAGAVLGAGLGGHQAWQDMFPPKDPEANVRTTESTAGTPREAEVVEGTHTGEVEKPKSDRGR